MHSLVVVGVVVIQANKNVCLKLFLLDDKIEKICEMYDKRTL